MTPVPFGPIVDDQGNPTAAFKAFLQTAYEALGQSWNVRLKRVDDTTVEVRLLGSDGTWRSNTLTLS